MITTITTTPSTPSPAACGSCNRPSHVSIKDGLKQIQTTFEQRLFIHQGPIPNFKQRFSIFEVQNRIVRHIQHCNIRQWHTMTTWYIVGKYDTKIFHMYRILKGSSLIRRRSLFDAQPGITSWFGNTDFCNLFCVGSWLVWDFPGGVAFVYPVNLFPWDHPSLFVMSAIILSFHFSQFYSALSVLTITLRNPDGEHSNQDLANSCHIQITVCQLSVNLKVLFVTLLPPRRLLRLLLVACAWNNTINHGSMNPRHGSVLRVECCLVYLAFPPLYPPCVPNCLEKFNLDGANPR